MSKFKGVVESRLTRLNDDNISDKHILKLGNPLPLEGTCKHNNNALKWLRYVCCGRLYPCGKYYIY
jgi:hypothetical protein